MFKRANKITSLLVAAAAVMSLVPAYAADVKKIDSEDGTVYGAVAYKDGKALIDGEVQDNDGAYFFADGKYTELKDVDSGSDYAAYGSKYAKVDDNDYFVNLEDGTVTDDNLHDDDIDDAASALRKEIKDVDRYNNNTTIAALNIIPGNKFGDTWYSTTDYKTCAGKVGNAFADTTNSGSYNLYTDAKGNYIDADYNLGKVKVEATTASASYSATIENTTDSEDLGSWKTSGYVRGSVELGQDKDNIYRFVELHVKVTGTSLPTSVKVNNKAFDLDTNNEVVLPVIQKISKAQASDDIDDAKYAKTVYNYVIAKDDATSLGDNGANGDQQKYYDKAFNGAKAAVIGGKLALLDVKSPSTSGDNVYVQAATLKQKNGWYYTDVEGETSLTAEVSSKLDKVAVDTDVDGNIYALDSGYVKEFDGTDDWNKVYKVDGSFDALSVYDKDNMVGWSQDDEVYSVIGAKKAGDTTTTPAVTAGWTQAADGTWSFVKADGTKATGWYKDTNGAWYFLKADGVMATGWMKDTDGTWYFLNASGAMATGWVNDGGSWYYLNASGAMLANTTTPDGYFVGPNGAWVK